MKVIAIIYKGLKSTPEVTIEMVLDCVPRKGDDIYFNDNYEIDGDLYVDRVEWCLDKSIVPHVNLIIRELDE
ncbi:MAG: hypothetical protein GY951_01990 [Psychromonas sp.]|nr:hypothetical protein [Psychromonas sp.]